MNIIDLFVSELDREVDRSRRALENLPEGKKDWKPHDKSMQFGYLANMVATMPSWLAMMIRQDELDIAPSDGGGHKWPDPNTREEYLQALEKAAADARAALKGTTEEHLQATGGCWPAARSWPTPRATR